MKTPDPSELKQTARDLKTWEAVWPPPSAPPESWKQIYQYYGLTVPPEHIVSAALPVASNHVAVHLVRRPDQKTRGTVYLLHGYLEHSLINSRLINVLYNHGFNVVAMDLIGHGFSSGKRGHIDDFAEYAEAFHHVVTACRDRLPGPFFGLGHSTGCAVLWEHARRYQDVPIHAYVFAAPLVRSFLWHLSLVGASVASSFTDRVKRRTDNSSHDPQFMTFIRERDPLQPEAVPLSWLDALKQWDERNQTYTGSCSAPLLVLQGDADTVVDWRYNLPYLKSRFPRYRQVMLPGAKHCLYNESDRYRKPVFRIVLRFLRRQSRRSGDVAK